MFFNGLQNQSYDEFGAPKKATKKKTLVVKRKTKPKKATKAISAGAGASVDETSSYDIPAGSKIRYVATFLTKTGIALSPGYSIIQRGYISNSKQKVKAAFEESFDNVNVTISGGGGAIEVNFTMPREYPSQTGLRQYCETLMSAAVGYRVDTSALAVVSKGQTITNSPKEKVQKIGNSIKQVVSDTSEATKEIAEKSAEGFFTSLGISLPVAIVIGGIALIILKK